MNHTENISNLLDLREIELILKYSLTVEMFLYGEKTYLESGRAIFFMLEIAHNWYLTLPLVLKGTLCCLTLESRS